jgi:hypothetical protein
VRTPYSEVARAVIERKIEEVGHRVRYLVFVDLSGHETSGETFKPKEFTYLKLCLKSMKIIDGGRSCQDTWDDRLYRHSRRGIAFDLTENWMPEHLAHDRESLVLSFGSADMRVLPPVVARSSQESLQSKQVHALMTLEKYKTGGCGSHGTSAADRPSIHDFQNLPSGHECQVANVFGHLRSFLLENPQGVDIFVLSELAGGYNVVYCARCGMPSHNGSLHPEAADGTTLATCAQCSTIYLPTKNARLLV